MPRAGLVTLLLTLVSSKSGTRLKCIYLTGYLYSTGSTEPFEKNVEVFI